MRRIRLIPYNSSSGAARELREAVDAKLIKLSGSNFVPRRSDIIINYGNNDPSIVVDLSVPQIKLNCVYNEVGECSTAVATNKLKAFGLMEAAGVTIPEYTCSRERVQQWLTPVEGRTAEQLVVVRSLLRGSGGRGISIISNGDVIPQAPLYTKYVPKADEYRVHVFNGVVIDVQKKMRSTSIPDERVNWRVRNLDNGFIYGREGIAITDYAKEQAILACSSLSLDFGAVDLIYNQHRDQYYVLEVNTAPGLTGTTLTKYQQAINLYLENV